MHKIGLAQLYIFEKKGQFLIHSLSNREKGGSIPTEPFIKLDFNILMSEVAENLIYAMSQTKTGIEDPKDGKAYVKEYMEALGLNKDNDFYKDVKNVTAICKNGMINFIAMENLGRRGFLNVSKEIIDIHENADIEKIAEALKLAINLCK